MNISLPHLTVPSNQGRRYLLTEKVGEGNQGVVFKSYSVESGTRRGPYALKMFKDSGSRHQFLREIGYAGVTLQSNHDVVAAYQDHSYHLDESYLVMEYVPRTLRHAIQDNAVTQQEVIDFMLQVPYMLDILQTLNIAHCDLRTDHFGYVNRTLKMLDFGKAIPFSTSVVRHISPRPEIIESPYFPPEFRRSYPSGIITKTFDTYTAGKTLEFLLTSTYEDTPDEALNNIESIHGITLPESFAVMFYAMTHEDHALRSTPQQLQKLARDAVKELCETELLLFNPNAFAAYAVGRAVLWPDSSAVGN